MEKKLTKKFNVVEEKFLKSFKNYKSKYSLKIKKEDISEQQRLRFKELTHKFPPCYCLHILLTNSTHKKKVNFIFTDGTNIDGAHYNSLRFFIENLDKKNNSSFTLSDYLVFKKIEEPIDDYFEVVDDNETTLKIDRFIEQVSTILQDEDIKSILTSKKWLNIPKNMSPYK